MKSNIQKSLSNLRNDQSGFTLIDVAISMMVIGLLVAPSLHMYHVWQKEAKLNATEYSNKVTNDAIVAYYHVNKRYPCPADPTLGPADADYGTERRDFGGTDDCIIGAPITTAIGRDADGMGGGDDVYIGAVPFKTLKMTPDEAMDAWNNKLLYAVTASQTDETTYDSTHGAITIEEDFRLLTPFALDAGAHPDADKICIDTADLTLANVTNPGYVYDLVENMHYIILSHGHNSGGAHDSNGGGANACPGGLLDEENCDNDATFKFSECLASDAIGANEYDDIVYDDWSPEILNSPPSKLWGEGDDLADVGTAGKYVGINNPDPQAELDVIGNIRAESDASDPTKTGRSRASDYCDSDGNNCFYAELIAGNEARMRCDNQQGMRGIGDNRARCSTALPSVPAFGCNPGEYITGISDTGVVTCAAP